MNKQKDFLKCPRVSRLSCSCYEVRWFLYKRICFKCVISTMKRTAVMDAGFSLVRRSRFLQPIPTVPRWRWGRKHSQGKAVLMLHPSKMTVFLISSKECLEKCARETSFCVARKGFSPRWAHSPCSRYAYGVFAVPFTCHTVFDLSFPPQGL